MSSALKAFDAIEAFSAGAPVLGGGDLNAGSSDPILDLLRARGHTVEGATIDWLANRGVDGAPLVDSRVIPAPRGGRVSDHPLVRGELDLPSHK
ncbi:MAG: hypothetical protein HY319_23010 [Armatimonadetes bacterium]|nr:hypothetical protein [Armatimonadota bacterium]